MKEFNITFNKEIHIGWGHKSLSIFTPKVSQVYRISEIPEKLVLKEWEKLYTEGKSRYSISAIYPKTVRGYINSDVLYEHLQRGVISIVDRG